MKLNKNNWDVQRKEFYKTVKARLDEVEDLIKYMKDPEIHGFLDFDAQYMADHDYRFLKDILGERCKTGMPWDYNTLIHLPRIQKVNGDWVQMKGDMTWAEFGILATADLMSKGPLTISAALDPDGNERVLFDCEIEANAEPEDKSPVLDTIKIGDTVYSIPGSSGQTVTKAYVDEQDELVRDVALNNIDLKAQEIREKDIDPLSTRIDNLSATVQDEDKKLQGEIDKKSTVSVSDKGESTEEVQYITIDGVEKKLAGGYEPDGNTIIFDDKNHLSVNDYISATEVSQKISEIEFGRFRTRIQAPNFIADPSSITADRWAEIIGTIDNLKQDDYVIVYYEVNEGETNEICDKVIWNGIEWVFEYRFIGDVTKISTDLYNHIGNNTIHITADERTTWNNKQNALTTEQLAACNSGITSTKVSTYDGYDSRIDDNAVAIMDEESARQEAVTGVSNRVASIEAKVPGYDAIKTEVWTFTLDDGSTVTKNVCVK